MLIFLLITWMDGSQTRIAPPPGVECSDYMVFSIATAHEMQMEYANMECIPTDIILSVSLPNV